MADEVLEIYLGTSPIQFIRTVFNEVSGQVENLSGAEVLRISFRKPARAGTFSRAASLLNDGTDGKVTYMSIDEIDATGEWEGQVYGRTAERKLFAHRFRFKVLPPIDLTPED